MESDQGEHELSSSDKCFMNLYSFALGLVGTCAYLSGSLSSEWSASTSLFFYVEILRFSYCQYINHSLGLQILF